MELEKAINTQLTYCAPDDPWLKRLLIQSIEFFTGRPKLERMLNEVLNTNPDDEHIWAALLAKINVAVDFPEEQLFQVPRKGPVIFVANHPFGVLDGLMLSYLVSLVRNDFKILVNEVMCRQGILTQYTLPIDFRETKEALRINIETRKTALASLNEGGAIAIFPSGGVATARRFWKKAEDLEWKRFVVKLVRQSGAQVVPIYFEGQNSLIFQLVSQFSLNLRLGLLLHEVCNKMGKSFPVAIGEPITNQHTQAFKNQDELLLFLKSSVFELAKNHVQKPA